MNHVIAALAETGRDRLPADWPAELDRFDPKDVRRLAAKPGYSPRKLAALVSPAARMCADELADMARRLTRQRHGNVITLFAPLYVSNYCVNRCRYCGFNSEQPRDRRRLTIDEALAEAEAVAAEGFRDLLLVAGEDPAHVGVPYISALARRLREGPPAGGKFATVSVEVWTLAEEEYRALAAAGIDGVTMFQETYDRNAYRHWHEGPKANYDNRLAGQESAARAGMRRLGIGALLGLQDWRFETLAMGVHAFTLARVYWRSRVSFSFPRIRPAAGAESEYPNRMSDEDLAQMIVALRLSFPDAGITLSTREPEGLRNRLAFCGVTQMSAGSRTRPGGYARPTEATEQFAVADARDAGAVSEWLSSHGFDPVTKDWDRALHA